MRQEKLTDDRIESLIREASAAFQPAADVKAALRERLVRGGDLTVTTNNDQSGSTTASSDAAESARRHRFRMLAHPWRLASAASFLLLVGAFGAYALWPAPLTLAQVRENVENAGWVHLTYDDGEERWWGPDRSVFARVNPEGHLFFADYDRGVEQTIAPHSTQIEQRPTTFTKSNAADDDQQADAWDIVVGQKEAIAERNTPDARWQIEDYPDVLNSRPVIRFDTYLIDPLERRILMDQIWADPIKRLPIKIRERLRTHEREDGGPMYVEGHYSFPATGPQSIYDLGVPRDVTIVHMSKDAPTDDVGALVEESQRARRNFLEHYRLIEWRNEERHSNEIDVVYWSGRATTRYTDDGAKLPDYRQVKLWQARYFNLGEHHPEYHLPMPATPDQIIEWTGSQVPVRRSLSADELAYSQDGPLPPAYNSQQPPTVRVSQMSTHPLFGRNAWIEDYQWPLIDRLVTDQYRIVGENDEGLIHLRWEAGDSRVDYHIDPTRDYICIRHEQWKRQGAEWRKRSAIILEELHQLPTGQWVTGVRRRWSSGTPEQGTSESNTPRNVHVMPLGPDEFPLHIFDGERFLEAAREMGATIETH